MRILNLNDFGVRRARRHPLLRGKHSLARGAFSAVFEGTRAATVLKLTMDGMHHAYLTDGCFAAEGPHAPRVVHDFGIVGETNGGKSIFLVELERLQPMPRVCSERRLVARAMRHVAGHRRLPVSEGELSSLPASLAELFERVNTFTSNFGCPLDRKVGSNFMLRPACGTVVVNDPVFDHRLMEPFY